MSLPLGDFCHSSLSVNVIETEGLCGGGEGGGHMAVHRQHDV